MKTRRQRCSNCKWSRNFDDRDFPAAHMGNVRCFYDPAEHLKSPNAFCHHWEPKYDEEDTTET